MPRLLEAQDISDNVAKIEVLQKSFTNEETGKAIPYNQLRLEFVDGEEILLKLTPEQKVIVHYSALK